VSERLPLEIVGRGSAGFTFDPGGLKGFKLKAYLIKLGTPSAAGVASAAEIMEF